MNAPTHSAIQDAEKMTVLAVGYIDAALASVRLIDSNALATLTKRELISLRSQALCGARQLEWTTEGVGIVSARIIVDGREFATPLDASLHPLWLLQRLSYYEKHREGMPADGPRFREGIIESRKLLDLLQYEP